MIWLAAILVVLAVAFGLAYRYHTAPEADGEVNGPDDVRDAAAFLGYQSQGRTHPIDCIDDPRIAASAIIFRVSEHDGMLFGTEIAAALKALQSGFGIAPEEAQALATLSHWIAAQHASQEKALRHLCKRCRALSGAEYVPTIENAARNISSMDRLEPGTDIEAALGYAISLLSAPKDPTTSKNRIRQPIRPISSGKLRLSAQNM